MPEVISRARKFEYLNAALSVVRDAGEEGISPREAFAKAMGVLKPSGIELQPYTAQPGIPRFQTIIRFMTIRAVKAGWMVKDRGYWFITAAGIDALSSFRSPDELGRASVEAYRRWKRSSDRDDVEDATDADSSTADDLTASQLETAQESALAGIFAHLRAMNEFTFQRMVATLLEALGYHVAWIAPPGPDHGTDIIVYSDPLGIQKPRIRVQVKHSQSQIGRPALQSFFGTLGRDDIGIFVSLSGFTKDAQVEARTHATYRVTLLDGDDFIKLWKTSYHKMTEAQKAYMRLEPVYFLAAVD